MAGESISITCFPFPCFLSASAQKAERPTTIPLKFRISYAIRFLVSLLAMEFVLHFMYVVAIKDAKAWGDDSPMELAMIGFFNLMVMWLKASLLTEPTLRHN